MPIILLHSSKTMRQPQTTHTKVLVQLPTLSAQSNELATYLKTLSVQQVQDCMKLSVAKATDTHQLLQNFDTTQPVLPAIDIFLGDIYSGLQVQTFTKADREYANKHLYILSGLYGVLRALDTIQPYRLEMGYRLPGIKLYEFWGDAIAKQLPKNELILNLSAVEYTKAVFPQLKKTIKVENETEGPTIITPKFLTLSPKTDEPTFVTVHTKIARGAFARWVIQNRVEDMSNLKNFADLGYEYDATLSTEDEPVFVAKDFQGLGLSVRLPSKYLKNMV